MTYNADPLSVRNIVKALKRVHVNNGDVVLLKRGLFDAQEIEALKNAGEKIGFKNVLLVVVNDFDDIRILNEVAMNSHGWFRVKTLNKLIHNRPDADRLEKEDGEEAS